MADERMSSRQYAKFEKMFFLYGSLSKMVSPVRPDEWKQLAEEMWTWAMVKVSALVDAYTEGFIDPPPDLSAPDMSVSDVATNGTHPHLKTKLITVKAVEVLKKGETRGRKWTATKIVDTDNIPYTTFAGHRYVVGKEYAIEYEEVQRGEYVDLRIKEPK
jgi:hypothetical protein